MNERPVTRSAPAPAPALAAGTPGGSASVRDLLAWGRSRLTGIEAASPAGDARALMEWALDVPDLWHAPDVIGAHAAERFRSGVAQRRHHVPLQHIIGRMWFRGLTLEAAPGVFICRPETEVVAGRAIDAARAVPSGEPLVVDLCTGSGAIALAVATEVGAARVWAVELSEEAVRLARRNIDSLAPGRVHLVHGDATTALAELDGRVDVVVSNPPYVPPHDVTQTEALADPDPALYGGGEDGLVIPRGIVHRAAALLREGGVLVMEHAEVQSAALREEASAAGFVDVRTQCDLAGRERMLVAARGARETMGE